MKREVKKFEYVCDRCGRTFEYGYGVRPIGDDNTERVERDMCNLCFHFLLDGDLNNQWVWPKE